MAAGSARHPACRRWRAQVVIYYASTLHGSGENRSPKPRTGAEASAVRPLPGLNFNYAFVDESGGRQRLKVGLVGSAAEDHLAGATEKGPVLSQNDSL